MTFAQILLYGYLGLSFIAAVIVYAACVAAGRQTDKSSTGRPRPPAPTNSYRRTQPTPLPTVSPALLKHDSLPVIDHAPIICPKQQKRSDTSEIPPTAPVRRSAELDIDHGRCIDGVGLGAKDQLDLPRRI